MLLVGKGAFMKDIESAEKLAKEMIEIGKLANRETVCVLSDMNEPLGYAVGNILEVIEAVRILKGEVVHDVEEVVLELGSYMLQLAGKGENIFVPRVKPIELSKAASYMGIFSLYSFASGEILVNTNLPDFLYPFTVFHEYVHFSGVMREGETNFIAFLTCYNSDIPALRYSGILNAKIYLLSAISKIDLDLYKEALKTLTAREREDISLYSEYISEYDTPFGESVSDINGLHQSVYDKDKVHTYAQFTVFLVGYFAKGV